ncbi:hypothetical protein [Marinobacter subterrani]|uniref:hypothetical protein n=1 Tax=Marinobacter subterrani TaxID=1658765 RepID=UPI001D0D702E|nr:hypothetical protein [Marinobacter subterrani]
MAADLGGGLQVIRVRAGRLDAPLKIVEAGVFQIVRGPGGILKIKGRESDINIGGRIERRRTAVLGATATQAENCGANGSEHAGMSHFRRPRDAKSGVNG